MIRSRVAHLRRIQSEDEQFRGLYISEREIDALLARPLGEPHWLHGAEPDRLRNLDVALKQLAEQIARRRSASLASGIDLRLDRLAARFGLDDFETDVLLICLAVEIDLRYERLYAYLQDDVTRKRPSIDLAVHLLASSSSDMLEARRHFLPSSPLIAHQLIHLLEDPQYLHAPLPARILKPDERIVEFLLGGDDLDARIRDTVRIITPGHGLDDLLLDDAIRNDLRNIWAVATSAPADKPWPVVVLQAPPGAGKRHAAEALCREGNRRLLIAEVATDSPDAEPGPASPSARWSMLAKLVEREAMLGDAAVHWRNLEALSGDSQHSSLGVLLRAIDAGRTPCFVAASDAADITVASFPRRGAIIIRMPEPSYAQRRTQWLAGLSQVPLDHDADVAGVAARFRLSLGRINQAAATARLLANARGGVAARVTTQDLQDACRLHSNQRLTALARKVASRYTWGDIVLPDDRMAQLREICNHVKYRERVYGEWGFGRKLTLGKGLGVLFAGPSGTGKTMAAGIIAAELGLDLYKVDLSSVISKYIGETEKNLSRIFDEAETSNAILFFDEADALFGKRSEVKDSHDRYANVEVGHLLQRMEEYEGVAILATNLRKNMDDAFVRRLQFTVEFPFPDQSERHRIWQRIWPKDTPLDEALDLELLATRYELAGGNIKNIAVAAAFLAADDGQVVRMDHVIQATQREYQKTGKLILEDHEAAPTTRLVRRRTP